MNQRGLRFEDAALEAAIEIATLRLATCTTPKQRKAAWAHLQELIEQRSPQQITRMERERGIGH